MQMLYDVHRVLTDKQIFQVQHVSICPCVWRKRPTDKIAEIHVHTSKICI